MIVKAFKTDKIVPGRTIFEVLDKYLPDVPEKSVVAITSKIVGICEGRVIPIGQARKQDLVVEEADFYLPENLSKYGFSFTITHHTLIPAAGIDESNGNGNYVLWPKDPQKSANGIRHYLAEKFKLKEIGVVITDSTARPLHYGTEGVAIGYSGFSPSNDYVGQKDLFGREFKVSISNVVDGLASAVAVLARDHAGQAGRDERAGQGGS